MTLLNPSSEPSLRWPSVASAVVDAARHLGVRQAVTKVGARSDPERGRQYAEERLASRRGAVRQGDAGIQEAMRYMRENALETFRME